jgi:hypothetical protein
MQRRKFIAGVGSLAAGAAAVTGTGAFSSAQANRTVNIEVTGDASAYLGLSEGPNTDVAQEVVANTGDTTTLNFNANFSGSAGGSGLNQNAITEFTNILTTTNQGTSEVIFGVDTSNIVSKSWIDDFNIYAHNDNGSPEYDGQYFNANGSYPADVSTPSSNQNPLVDLTTGEAVDLSVQISTNDTTADTSVTLPFIAVEKGGRYDNTQGDNF